MKDNNNRYWKYSLIEMLIAALLIFCWWKYELTDSILLWILMGNLVAGLLFIWRIPSYALQLQLLILAVSTGLYGFETYAGEGISFLDACYSTLRLFLLNMDSIVMQNNGWLSSYPLSLEIARWSAVFYTATAVFAVVSKLFGQSIRLFWYQWLGGHYVVYGYHKHTKILLKNLRREKKRVVIVAETMAEADKAYLEDIGVVVLVNLRDDRKRFRKSRLKKAGYYLIFHEDDTRNLEELFALKEHFFKNESMKEFLSLHIYLHLQHQKSYDIFEKYVARLKAETKEKEIPKFLKDYVPVRVVNIYQLMAEKVWDDYPLYKGYEQEIRNKNGNPFQLSIIGFGDTGRSVYMEALERAHFFNVHKWKTVILDRNASVLEKQWKKGYSKISYIAETQFSEYDSESALISEYEETLEKSTHIIVSLPDGSTNMVLGMELSRKFPTKPIYIKMEKEAFISHWIHEDDQEFKNIICFGDWNDVLNYQYFINEEMDKAAKMVHGDYIKNNGKGVPSEWERLDDFKKESNRKQVAHALTKVVLAGFQPVKELKAGDREVFSDEFKNHVDPFRQELKSIEHQRWNAFHYIRGWDTNYEIKKNDWKDENSKLHGCIVPFEKLPEVSEIVQPEKPFESHGERTIDQLYKTVVEELKYKIIQDKESER